jgi:4-aminobutyrate aminotransferase-like enzyme
VRTILDEGLVENSARVGALMLERLETFKEKFPFVGDVRGKGLMIGMELVKNPHTRERLDKKHTTFLFQECLQNGLILMGYNPDIRINPPLIITEEVALEGIEIMERAFTRVADRINI